jgi:predicted Zn-dependent peptidase
MPTPTTPPTITTHTLPGGLPVIIEPLPGVRSVSLAWLIPAGTAHEPTDRLGLSTLAAELLLRGAGSLNSRAQADALDALGIVRSADVTGYYLRLTATMLGNHLPAALPLLVDMIRKPRFEQEHLEPARDLALQALASLSDNPQERASLLLAQRHNPRPLDRSHYGTEDGLSATTRDDLLNFWSKHSTPNGAILAIAGDADPARIIPILDQLLAGWSGPAHPVELSTSPTRGSYHHVQDDAASQVHIYLAHESPAESDPLCPMERLLTAVLSGGSSCRLFSEVREKRGLCYSVSASYAADRAFGRTTAYVGTTPDKAQQSLDVLLSELRKVNGPTSSGGGITDEELTRTKTRVKSNLIFSGESSAARAGSLAGDMHRLGRPRPLSELAQQLDAITLNALNGYLCRRTLPTPTIVTLGPRALSI